MEDFRPENPKRPARTGEHPKNGEPAAPAAGGPHRQDAASRETDLCVTPDPCDGSRGFSKVELSTLILKRVEVRSLGMTKTTSKSESGSAKLAPGAGVQSGPAGRPASEAVTLARQSETGRNGPGSRRRVRRRRVRRGRPGSCARGTDRLTAGGWKGWLRAGVDGAPRAAGRRTRGHRGPQQRWGGEGCGRARGLHGAVDRGPRGQEGRVHLQLPTLVLGNPSLPRGEQLPRPNRPVCLGSAPSSPDRAGAGAAGPGWRPAPPLVSLCLSLSICDLPDIVLFYVSENFIYYHFSGFSRGSKDKWV